MKNLVFISLALGLAFSSCDHKNSRTNTNNESGYIAPLLDSVPLDKVDGDNTASDGSLIPLQTCTLHVQHTQQHY